MEKKKTVKVLYQRIGNEWYAFSVVDGEMFYTRIAGELINDQFVEAPSDVQSDVVVDAPSDADAELSTRIRAA